MPIKRVADLHKDDIKAALTRKASDGPTLKVYVSERQDLIKRRMEVRRPRRSTAEKRY